MKRYAAALTLLVLAACDSAAPPAKQDNPPAQSGDGASPAATSAPPSTGAPAKVPPAVTTLPDGLTRGLCAADEAVIAACHLQEGRVLSICGARDHAGEEFAQYRFGWANRTPELVWPKSPADGRMSFASVPYSGGGEAQMGFARGSTRYIVYSRVYRTNFEPGETNDPAFEDGVTVLRNGQQIAHFACDQSAIKPIDYDVAKRVAWEDRDAFVELDLGQD